MFSQKKSLSKQLLGIIFGLFLLVAITVTFIQMYVDYRQTENVVSDQIIELEQTFKPGIANALWTFDESQL